MKTRILVIDDNFEFAEEVRQALEKQNYEVDIACNGREGLSKSDGVECILLDLVMPVMDGFAFLEKFDKKSTKIIAISALSQDVFIARSKHVSTHKIWVAVLAFTSRFRLFLDVTEVANTI